MVPWIWSLIYEVICRHGCNDTLLHHHFWFLSVQPVFVLQRYLLLSDSLFLIWCIILDDSFDGLPLLDFFVNAFMPFLSNISSSMMMSKVYLCLIFLLRRAGIMLSPPLSTSRSSSFTFEPDSFLEIWETIQILLTSNT